MVLDIDMLSMGMVIVIESKLDGCLVVAKEYGG
jgi:hypothetical protein